MSEKRLTLITGASRGIGRALAVELATKYDHQILALARSKTALEGLDDEIKAAGGAATLIPMDLGDPASIEQLGAIINQRWGRLDGLVGNAGILGPISPVHTVTPKSWEQTIEINLNANWRLIRSLDPLLRQSPSGRAVFVTSGVVPRPRAFWGPYQASKAGLEALVTAWAEETHTTNMRINLFDPGATRTDMRADAMPGEDPMTLPPPEEVAAKLAPLLTEDCTDHGKRFDVKDM